MAYGLDIDPEAREQLRALPAEIRPAVAEVMAVPGLVPWNGVSINDANPGTEVRRLRSGPAVRGL